MAGAWVAVGRREPQPGGCEDSARGNHSLASAAVTLPAGCAVAGSRLLQGRLPPRQRRRRTEPGVAERTPGERTNIRDLNAEGVTEWLGYQRGRLRESGCGRRFGNPVGVGCR